MVLNHETEIEMLLFDQERIVSYKELSTKLNINPAEARKLINDFIKVKRDSNKAEFHVTYLVTGEKVDTKKKRLFLANEADLNTLDDIKIVHKQVYSIQKNPINDFDLIYGNDLDASLNIHRKSNLIVISKTIVQSMDEGDDDEMMLKMMDNRENQNPNDLKKSQTLQADELKRLNLNSVVSSDHKPAVITGASKNKANQNSAASCLPTKSVDTKVKAKVKDELYDDESESKESTTTKKAKLNSEEGKKTEDIAAKPAPAPAATASKQTGKNSKVPAKNQPSLTSFFKKK
jgi:hypothetical protein